MQRVKCQDCGTWVDKGFTHRIGWETVCVPCAIEFQKGLEELMDELEANEESPEECGHTQPGQFREELSNLKTKGEQFQSEGTISLPSCQEPAL